MKLLFSKASAALAIVVSCTLTGCDLFSAPPTQLEAKLTTSGPSVEDEDALARKLVQKLNVKDLKIDNVRVVFDKDQKATFFRVVGKEALPPALLQQVGAGLARLNQEITWQGKLIVEASPWLDAFLKTDKREFPIVAAWQGAEVEAFLLRSAAEALFGQTAFMLNKKDLPEWVACVLSFAPNDKLPPLKGKMEDAEPEHERPDIMIAGPSATAQSEITVPHRVIFTQAELARLKEPVVVQGKLYFQFALIEGADVTVAGGDGDGDPTTIDHRTIDLCRSKLREVAPKVQAMMDSAAMIGEVAAIGPARLVALPKAR